MSHPHPHPHTEPHTDPAAISAIVRKARASFDAGRTRPLTWRHGQLRALEAMLSERGEELVEALRADLGKPVLEAWAAEVGAVKQEAALARKNLARWTRPEKVSTPASLRPARSRIVREPLGVALVIAPWNYPVQLLLAPLVGAVAAGNAVVLKPSEVTAHTSRALARAVGDFLDPEAVGLVQGGAEETRALLAERFDHIFYTGSGRVGRIVMEAAARNLTPVTLELGGKSPCIVDADVDVEVAARRIAWGKFLNAGQTCVAPDYVMVHEDRQEALVEALERAVRAFYGEDPRASDDYARIVSPRHHERLAKLLEGLDVAFGGQVDAETRYIAPTVVRDVATDSPLMQEEIFGPILPVLRVPDVASAVDFVRSGDKPLALYVFTCSAEVEEEVLQGTSSGGVCVNGVLWHLANPQMPFGGVGASGMGAYHGRHTFETFSHRKAVLTKGWRFDPRVMYPPYGRLKTALVKRFL